MCGILGYYSKRKIEAQKAKTLSSLLNMLFHRGPDAKGEYTDKHKMVFLGHTRLSIIDLDERANQPMKRGSLVIVFNGEIYNYKEIREELKNKGYTFLTNSDTEVLLFAYKEWGKNCLAHLRGMFAFCIYDEEKRELFCARDRIGEKPLIYAETDEGVIISSEIKPILKSGMMKMEVDEEVLGFLYVGNYKHIPEPFSVWKGIKKLKPGSYMIVRDGKIVEENFYWKPKVEQYWEIPPQKLREKVIEAVQLSSVSDVPISVLLSGGTDSSIVAFVLKEVLRKDVVAFTFGRDEEDGEVLRAKNVAKILGIPIRIFYLDKKSILERMKEIIAHYTEPLHLLQLAYADILYENIRREGIKVVLTGNGADEIFYGYTAHTKTYLLSLILKLLPANNVHWKIKIWLNSAENNLSLPADRMQKLLQIFAPLIEPFKKKYYIDFSNFWGLISENAHSITMIGDIVGMKNSVEVRSPFLDYQLVELAYSVHPRKKLAKLLDNSGKFNKFILKKAFWNTSIAPVFSHTKMGFGFNIGEARFFNSPKDFAKWSIEVWKEKFLY